MISKLGFKWHYEHKMPKDKQSREDRIKNEIHYAMKKYGEVKPLIDKKKNLHILTYEDKDFVNNLGNLAKFVFQENDKESCKGRFKLMAPWIKARYRFECAEPKDTNGFNAF